jgi:hypothetical protein
VRVKADWSVKPLQNPISARGKAMCHPEVIMLWACASRLAQISVLHQMCLGTQNTPYPAFKRPHLIACF